MTGSATNCECGRPLLAGEILCPSCERVKQSSWWNQVLFTAVTTASVIALAIVTAGKKKPNT